MRLNLFALGMVLLLAGCATPRQATLPRRSEPLPPDAFITERAVLTARGRQFTLNGYLSLSSTGGMRLIMTENFGSVMADVLVKPDGTVHVMRSSRLFRPKWIEKYVVADLNCIFGNSLEANCPGEMLSPNDYLIRHRWYTLDLQIVETKAGLQSSELFDETKKVTP